MEIAFALILGICIGALGVLLVWDHHDITATTRRAREQR